MVSGNDICREIFFSFRKNLTDTAREGYFSFLNQNNRFHQLLISSRFPQDTFDYFGSLARCEVGALSDQSSIPKFGADTRHTTPRQPGTRPRVSVMDVFWAILSRLTRKFLPKKEIFFHAQIRK